jgi:hypothetical protein
LTSVFFASTFAGCSATSDKIDDHCSFCKFNKFQHPGSAAELREDKRALGKQAPSVRRGCIKLRANFSTSTASCLGCSLEANLHPETYVLDMADTSAKMPDFSSFSERSGPI